MFNYLNNLTVTACKRIRKRRNGASIARGHNQKNGHYKNGATFRVNGDTNNSTYVPDKQSLYQPQTNSTRMRWIYKVVCCILLLVETFSSANLEQELE